MGAIFLPFEPSHLEGAYGSFNGYRDCVSATVARLEAERLYDPKVETAKETAERVGFSF